MKKHKFVIVLIASLLLGSLIGRSLFKRTTTINKNRLNLKEKNILKRIAENAENKNINYIILINLKDTQCYSCAKSITIWNDFSSKNILLLGVSNDLKFLNKYPEFLLPKFKTIVNKRLVNIFPNDARVYKYVIDVSKMKIVLRERIFTEYKKEKLSKDTLVNIIGPSSA